MSMRSELLVHPRRLWRLLGGKYGIEKRWRALPLPPAVVRVCWKDIFALAMRSLLLKKGMVAQRWTETGEPLFTPRLISRLTGISVSWLYKRKLSKKAYPLEWWLKTPLLLRHPKGQLAMMLLYRFYSEVISYAQEIWDDLERIATVAGEPFNDGEDDDRGDTDVSVWRGGDDDGTPACDKSEGDGEGSGGYDSGEGNHRDFAEDVAGADATKR